MKKGATKPKEEEATLYTCEPVDWLWMPKPLRKIVGWTTIMIFAFSFASIPMCGVFLVPYVWRVAPVCTGVSLSLVITSFLVPTKEWPFMRTVGQLWYEIFQVSANRSTEQLMSSIDFADDHQLMICMHPHGIVPFHAVLWAAYCNQYCSDAKTNRNLYGFGAAADAVAYVPFLRNIMGWLSAGSATYSVLKAGLAEGKAPSVNAAGRKPKHLYILPGGVAEIFTSAPGRHSIVFKKRRGLVKLAIETQTCMIPCYVFGGTDFYHNLATDGGFFARLSRKTRAGLTLFWGPYYSPVPYAPKITIVMGEPIPPPSWDKEGAIPADKIEELHAVFLKQMIELFDRYKAGAGYPDAQLEVL